SGVRSGMERSYTLTTAGFSQHRRTASLTTCITRRNSCAPSFRTRRSKDPSMMRGSTVVNLPEAARVNISSNVASDLLAAAERLPRYENLEFYSSELQVRVCGAVREGCPEAFDTI